MKKKSLKEINAIESEMISNANALLEQMAEPKYHFEVNPLEDIKSAIDLLKKRKREIEKSAKELEDKNDYISAMMHWCNAESLKFAIAILKAGNI